MRAVDVEIAARRGIERGLRAVLPHRDPSRDFGNGVEVAPRGEIRQPGRREIARLGTDRDHRPVDPVAFLALVLVRHRIADAVRFAIGALERHRHAAPAERERRILAIGIPDIGQRHPARRAVDEQPRLDRAPAVDVRPAEAFDEHRPDRKFDRPVGCDLRLLRRGDRDETLLVGIVAEQRRAQRIADAGRGLSGVVAAKQAERRKLRRHRVALDERLIDAGQRTRRSPARA